MDQAELKRLFHLFDHNGDGNITMQELSHSLQNLGIHVADKDLMQTIDKGDINGDGHVGIEEFGALYRALMEEKDEEQDMQGAFGMFDQNGDGFITVEELSSVMRTLGLNPGCTIEDCKNMIRNVDIDGDGMVNYIEFKQMMKGGKFADLGS